MSSHSAGWMARVYSSVRSCLILRSSTQHRVRMRLNSRRTPDRGRSAQPAGGAPGAAYVTYSSRTDLEGVSGVMPEHVDQGDAGAQSRLELGRGALGADAALVHQRDPVAVGVGLVHVVGGHEHRHPAHLPFPFMLRSWVMYSHTSVR